jgi:hypothetical protein
MLLFAIGGWGGAINVVRHERDDTQHVMGAGPFSHDRRERFRADFHGHLLCGKSLPFDSLPQHTL